MIAFIFADLIVLPIVAIYRKYYGDAFALRITALMFVDDGRSPRSASTACSALVGLDPATRGRRADDVFGSVELDYKLVLNVLALGDLRRAVRADRPRAARPTRSAG